MFAVKNLFAIALSTLLCFWIPAAVAKVERIGDFALLDDQGEFHQLSRYLHRKALVMMAYDPNCVDMPAKLNAFSELQSRLTSENVEFVILNSLDKSREESRSWGLDYAVLKDDGQLVSEMLGIDTAGQVMVFNPERLTVLYRGPMAATVSSTLDTFIEEGLSDTVSLESDGCKLDFPVKELHAANPPDYSTEIAPIIVENCAQCHRWGGVGPFALDAYISVLGWSPMIREVLLNKRMPPMQVDPEIGHSTSAQYIDADDVQALIHWMDAGAPRGDNEVDPLEAVPIEKIFEWQLGEPDYIVQANSISVPAVGVQDYVYSEVELPFDEDVRIKAYQYNPGKEAVLHHLMTFVTPPDEDFWGPEKDNEITTRRFLGSYIPGENPAIVFPENASILIPKGHKLSLQSHYVTNGLATTDETSIGLYFADDTDTTEVITKSVSARFVIPPNESNHDMAAQYTFEESVVLTGLRARMNFRGKKMKFIVEKPNGDVEDLFSIPAYNYGWQPHYQMEENVLIESGSTVHVVGAFDNSLSNPFNPDPSEEVSFGLNSWEEMFTGYLTYYPAD